MAQLYAIPVWIGDDGNAHAIAHRFDWASHDGPLRETGQERWVTGMPANT